jgi:hypothetical protein
MRLDVSDLMSENRDADVAACSPASVYRVQITLDQHKTGKPVMILSAAPKAFNMYLPLRCS